MFLVGKAIPEHIKALPQTVLNTPFGQMLRPQIDQSLRPLTQAPPASTSASSEAQMKSTDGEKTDGRTEKVVHNSTSLSDINSLLSTAPNGCVVILFTSSTCPPCKLIYPTYDGLALEYPKITFIKVDINYATEAASNYRVRATPTFISFLKQKKYDEWSGADKRKLRSNVELLMQAAFPPHPHLLMYLPTLLPASLKTITYANVPPLEKVIPKIETMTNGDDSIDSLINFLEAKTENSAPQEQPLPDLDSFCKFLSKALSGLTQDNLFAAYDLLRPTLVDKRINAFFASGRGSACILELLKYVNILDKCPYNLKLVTLQIGCNLLSHEHSQMHIMESAGLLKQLTSFVLPCLTNPEKNTVQISAASIVYNIAIGNFKARSQEQREAMPEEKQVEVGAALLEAISLAENADYFIILLRGLGLLLYCAPLNGELLDLCHAMEATKTISSKIKLCADRAVAKEIQQLLSNEQR